MRIRSWIGLAAVLAIALGSLVGALIVDSDDRSNFERTQHEEAARSARQAQAVVALSAGQLSSTAAFYGVEGSFSRHEFDVIARPLLRQGALVGTSFVASVRLSERARFERIHGFPIVQRRGNRLQRAGVRREYFPITFADSKLGGAQPLGYDLGVDPSRGPILRRAAASGAAEATPVVPFLVHSDRGLIIYQPVYRDGAPTATVAERRAALLGFASGAFKVGALVAAATSVIPADVTVQLDQNGRRVAGTGGVLHETASAPIHAADLTWILVLHDRDGPSVSLPILMAVFGISLACLLGALILIWSRNERMQELQRQAGQDSLTGLKNRRRFEEDLRSEMARSGRMGRTGALMMLDLDYFKRVNDSLGHPAGDLLIREIAGVLKRRARATDVLARLGGDEFAIVLPQCDSEEAQSVAEAIAAAIREHAVAENGPPVTASIGIAMFGADPRTSFESVVAEADAAMYAAKDAGRDGVRVFDPLAVRSDA